MPQPLSIGLLSQGGREWIGGLELTKNTALATLAHCRATGRDVRIHVICNDLAHRDYLPELAADPWVNFIAGVPDGVVPSERSGVKRLYRKLTGRLKKSPLGRMVRDHGITFLYPLHKSCPDVPCRTAAWIFDFQHKHLPHYFSAEDLRSRDKLFRRIAESFSTVVLSSESAARDFRAAFPAHADKARVLPFRVSLPKEWIAGDTRETANAYHLPREFFIVCNQFWLHKNHLLALEAIRHAVNSNPRLVVVFTGSLHDPRSPKHLDRVLGMIHTLGIHDNCRVLGLIPKRDQVALLKEATAVIQPSLFEGWSTIVEEARLLNKRLIVSDIDVHREQAWDDVIFFDPHDARTLADAMARARAEFAGVTAPAGAGYDALRLQFGRDFVRLAEGT